MLLIELLFLGALAAPVAAPAAAPPAAPAAAPAALESLPDPTRPYQFQANAVVSMPTSAEAQMWRLSGIQVRNGVRRAILNGKIVKVGDVIGNAMVTAIGNSDITLTVDRRPIVVQLLITQIKQDVAAIHKQKSAGTE